MALLLGEVVRRQARYRPERTAYVIGAAPRHLPALRRARRTASPHALRALGVGRGDRVATLAQNRVEYPAIYFAVAKLGAIHVPINFRYRAGEIRYALGAVRGERAPATPREFADVGARPARASCPRSATWSRSTARSAARSRT